jgi:hypothetical protein
VSKTEDSRASEALWIYHRALFDENLRLVPVQGDHGPESGRIRTRRGGRDQGRTQPHELIGLDDYRVADTALLTPTRASRRRQPKNLAANHVN